MDPDVAARWRALRDRLDERADEMKDSQWAVIELSRRYEDLTRGERKTVDQVLASWTLDDDESLRFDALALVSDHRIKSALPALAELVARLEADSGPGAPYERKKVERLIHDLSG